jgi:four helix bundle protein
MISGNAFSQAPLQFPTQWEQTSVSKITIVEEEADECVYWLELIELSETLTTNDVAILKKEASELTAIFTASGKTAKESIQKK